ncbi:DUF1538 domain-containing protein [Pseudomonas sp. B21-040]|jgi:hypothetical protein|uniref:DUF1538 domain-containing protein n=1 Tax=unclassified Pseudomonas TaxID=196821 RepID=UPI000D6BA78F|nr:MULTISPECIES: DUF1538 domain-containing protein [unclassified Pseudomonas]PWK45754.1 uncharacterized protein DUF1538 [Pseudomonas sp. OV226]UVL43288.1 DUF1538 domain-containing protein [Pseudomonas sp. B21-040]
MKDSIRYADYMHMIGAGRREIPMRELVSAPVRDADGRWQAAPHKTAKLRAGEIAAILKPYLNVRLMEQVRAVVPLALYLVLFQIIILRQLVEDSLLVTGGLFAVIVGLMLFMEGLKLGLMPFGEIIGSNLPRKLSLPVVLLVTLLLGIGVTFAEPAIGALRAAGQNVSAQRAPYLWAILNQWTSELVLVVGASVGLAAVTGTLRFLYGWSLKPLIYLSLAPVLLLTVYMSSDPELAKVIGLAWDAGAVTTGPVTVPLVLALGIGIAAAAGKGGSGLSGFGIVTLASLFPVIGVMLLGLYVAAISSPAEIVAAAQAATEAGQLAAPWHEVSPGLEIVSGLRAIVPLVIFLMVVLKLLLRQNLPRRGEILLGIALTVVGMCVFNLGLTYGLSKLGGSAGSLIPAAFMQTPGADNSPLYIYQVGLVLALAFAWVLGYGATVAEPALNALGVTAETLTNGFIRKRSLIRAVSIGVACGIAVGVAKLVFGLPLVWLVVPPYLIAVVLTVFSTEEFVNVAWDSAGVTTGPITVPLVLAMGLGLGNATNAVEGFGILCMASVGPVISVMLLGQWARFQLWRQTKAATQQPANQLLNTGEAG